MKKIEAYLKPFRVANVRNALANERFDQLQLLVAEELRPAEPFTEVVQGTEYEVDAIQRAVLVLLVEDRDVEEAVRLIREAAQTDHSDDGRILISSVERVVSIDPTDSSAPQPLRSPTSNAG